MAEFDLAKLMKQASESNDRERIEYINIQDIQADPHNFYSTDGIDELAANIEMVGLQQPIRVRKVRIAHSLPEGGYEPFHDVYRVVSGHRRLAAWKKLDLNCPGETYRKIAAIVEPERREPEALQELRLIFANSDTRRMTGPDLQQQARRIRELLKILKNDGYEFKGRMRDQVAQICGVSKSKLSRLDAIENNLHAGIKGAYYNTGKISETLAYEISRLPKEDQSEVCRKLGKGWEPTCEDLMKWYRERAVDRNMKMVREKLKGDYDKLTAAIEEQAEDEAEEDDAEDPENVPRMGTLPAAEWQTGDPPADGRYLCLVDMNTTKLHEQKCDRKDGAWFCYGSPIADMFTVEAWWPLPPEGDLWAAARRRGA